MIQEDFEQHVVKLQNALLGFAKSLTHNEDEAKDLLQETSLKALSNKAMYDDSGSIKSWLYTMLNSTCKCNRILINNLFKFFVWREVSKSFTRSIIEFIFNPLNLFVGYFTKVLTLWDILPDKPVGVFIGTTFP